MSHPHSSRTAPRMPRRLALVTLLSAAGLVVLPSCGGGGGGGGGATGGTAAGGSTAGVDTGGTGSFSTGRISGFGSVIVSGVRFEDNAARVADDDDEAKVLATQDLKLGMVVRVQAGAVTAGSGDILPSSTATTITVESQIKGPVQSKTSPDTLVVFGQTVKVTASTVFDGTSFATIATGDILEVHGFADATGVVTASRIEREAGATEFKVRGFISGLNTTTKTFQIGAATFNYGSATRLPTTALSNGLFVRVRTQTAANASGQWVVNRIDLRQAVEDRTEAKVEGVLVQNGTVLSVNGITINTSGLPAGTAIPVGQRVEIEGALVNGVLVARTIQVENEAEEAKVDVRGTASLVNKTAQTFVVRGVTFHYSGGTQQKDGTVAVNLTNGANIRVRGTLSTGGTGNVEATEIDFTP
jgi:hypothetical protein